MVWCAFCPALVDTDDDPESCVGDTYRCESCREDCAIADAADARNDERELELHVAAARSAA